MNLLLTGVTGFVGRNLLLKLLEEASYDAIYVPVRSADKFRAQLQGDGFEEIPSRVKPVELSAPNWDFSQLPAIDHVVHSAGTIFASTKDEYYKTNVDGTLTLLRTIPLSPNSRTVILSSQAAAGPCADGSCRNEDHTEAPVTWYGESKLEMERKVKAEFGARLAERPYLFLRPPMIFGPRDQATLPLFKMARLPLRVKPGNAPKFFSYLAVSDLVDAILTALKAPSWDGLAGKAFFVASDEPVSDVNLITLCGEAQKRRGFMLKIPHVVLRGVSEVVERVPKWRNEIPNLTADRVREIWPERWVVSADNFAKGFRWKPREELTKTLQLTRDWYVKTGKLPA